MKIQILSACAAAIVSATLATSANAAVVIADYPFTANNNSTDADGNSLASAFAQTGGGGPTSSGVGNPSPSRREAAWGGTDQADAIVRNVFWHFTVTPNAEYELDLTSLSFNIQADSNIAHYQAKNWFVLSSVDAYTNAVGSGTIQATANNDWSLSARSIDLSASAFQNLAAPVTFRIYLYGAADTTGTYSSRIDNVALSGDVVPVPVPEPVGLGMVAAGCTGLLLRRRKA